MLKCTSDYKYGTTLVKTGKRSTVHETAVETLAIIKVIYEGICEQNKDSAELYKQTIIGALIDPESPVWKVDDHGKT